MESLNGENQNDSQSAFTSIEQSEQSEVVKIRSAWKLLKESIAVFRSKFKILVLIMLLPVFFSLMLQGVQLLSVASEALSQSFLFSILKVLLWLASLYVSAISTLTVVYAVKDDTGAKESYSKAISNSIAYVLMVLFGSLVIVGCFMFFIVPGILFAVWLSLIVYVFAFEDTRGLTTLRRSKQLIQGSFWKIVWRTLIFMPIVSIVLCIPFIILSAIFGDKYNLVPLGILLLVYPIILLFGLQLYKNLAEIKKDSFLEEPKKIHKFGYYFAMAIAIPVFSAFVLLQILNLSAYDIPNPNDADLQLQALNIPKQDNAFYVFLEAKDKIYLPEDKLAKGLDDSLAQEIIQKNEQALALLDKGVSLPVFQQPELQNPKDFNASQMFTGVSFLRNLAKINAIKAVALQVQGKEKDALDQSMKTIRMAQMIQDSQVEMLTYLTSLSIKEIGLSNFRGLVQHSNLNSSELLKYVSQLDKYDENGFSLQKTLKFEYVTFSNEKEASIDPIFRGEKPREDSSELLRSIPQAAVTGNIFYYQPNKTKLLFAQEFRGMIENINKDNYSLVTHVEKMPSNWTIIFQDNAIGKILSKVLIVSIDGLIEKGFEEKFSVRGTQLLVALKAYKQTTGNLPDSLSALVPSYLSELPQDPFDGNVIRYSKEKGIIYSIGRDLQDNNGNISEDDWKQGSDIGFKLLF